MKTATGKIRIPSFLVLGLLTLVGILSTRTSLWPSRRKRVRVPPAGRLHDGLTVLRRDRVNSMAQADDLAAKSKLAAEVRT